MTISPTLHQYLAAEGIEYTEIPHVLTMSSALTAQACHVSGDRLAKAIVLRRSDGYLLAVLPASHRLRLADLRARFGDDIALAAESEIDRLFEDCAHGAVPAAGICYGLDVIVDDGIRMQPDVYMEAGDHETLLHLGRAQFARLTAGSLHGCFSAPD